MHLRRIIQMADVFTAKDLKSYLKKRWSSVGCSLKHHQRMGVSIGKLVNYSAKRNGKLKDPHFELWIAVYDEFVSWLVSLAAVVHWNKRKRPYQPTDFEQAVVILLMRIVSDSLAIRHLMLLGFDASAQTQVRSTTEHMEVMVAILDDPAMATEFCKSRDVRSANKFWKAYLSKQKIRPRIKAVWMKFFSDDHSAAKWFANWGNSDYPELSAIAHPSFMGCVHAVLPAKVNCSDEAWLGVWGDRSLTSIGTTRTYISFLFPLILAIDGFPFGKKTKLFAKPRRYSPDNELHRHVKYGRSVLGSLVLSLNSESNVPYIYPQVASLAKNVGNNSED